MKVLMLLTALFSSNFSVLMAKDVNPYEDNYVKNMNEEYKTSTTSDKDMKVAALTKLLNYQQKSYEDKIAFIESELRKTKDRLIEKSLNQEKIEDAMKEKYGMENFALKKELAYKTKALMEVQRQIEKMKPSEEMKDIIKMNSDLAAELRAKQDTIAVFQLKNVEGKNLGDGRLPASVDAK